MSRAVPIIDIGPFLDGSDPHRVVGEVDGACRELGFLVISGHGVSPEVLDRGVEAMRAFFAQPEEAKAGHVKEGYSSGYSEFANMSLGQSLGAAAPADLREGFSAKRRDILNPASPAWGDEPATREMRLALTDYYFAMNAVADTLMQIFALALGRERDYFEQFTYRHDSNLGIFHYPPMQTAPLPGQLRGGAHTDFGGVTVLHASPSVEGLQVWNGDDWEDVPVVEGAFVINLGDLMKRWTNDVWNSTLHRVANPVDGAWDSDRLSIAFFHQPNKDALIQSLDDSAPAKYPAITSGEHFTAKIEAMRVSA
jgi:isopenicillin N synthase-like dioxygenase